MTANPMTLPRSVNRLLLLGLLLLAGLGKGWAQVDLDKTVRNLQKVDCLEKKTASDLRTRIAAGSISDEISLLDEICAANLRQVFGRQYRAEMLDGTGLKDAGIDTLLPRLKPAALDKIIEAVTKSSLIDTQSQASLKKGIATGRTTNTTEILVALRRELRFRESVSPLKLQGLAQQLRANGLVSHAESGKLIRAIDDAAITDPFQMLDFCNNARRFEASAYSTDPDKYLQKIHAETAALLPELEIEALNYEFLPAPPGKSVAYLRVTLQMGGQSYWQVSPLPTAPPSTESFAGRIDPQSYYRIFNKALAETGSLYRLHLVTCNLDDDLGMGPVQRFGIIALRESQPEAFRYLGSYYTFSKEDFRTALTRDLVAGVIERYFSFGLFSPLTLQEYREARAYALSNPRMSYEEVLDCFPGTFLTLSPPEGSGSYRALLESLAGISRGTFDPQNITESDRFSFAFGGDTWAAQLQPYATAPDPAFFGLLDQAMATLPEGRFYQLPKQGKYIFLNTEQWDLLHRQKVVGKQK